MTIDVTNCLDLSVDLRDVVGDRLLLSGEVHRDGVSPVLSKPRTCLSFLSRQTLMLHKHLC